MQTADIQIKIVQSSFHAQRVPNRQWSTTTRSHHAATAAHHTGLPIKDVHTWRTNSVRWRANCRVHVCVSCAVRVTGKTVKLLTCVPSVHIQIVVDAPHDVASAVPTQQQACFEFFVFVCSIFSLR